MKYCKSCGSECSGLLEVMITPKKIVEVCKYCFQLPLKELKKKVKK